MDFKLQYKLNIIVIEIVITLLFMYKINIIFIMKSL